MAKTAGFSPGRVNTLKGEHIMALKGIPAHWESETKIAVIRDALTAVPHNGTDCTECKRAARSLYDLVGIEPLVFKTKVGGQMVALPKGKERWSRFLNLVREVHAYIDAGDFTSSEPVVVPFVPEPNCGPCANGLCGDCGNCDCCPAPITPAAISAAHKRFLSEVRRLRTFASDRDIDHISYRPIKDGARMISAGIPVEACIHAMTLHWEDADRRQAGIKSYDPMTDFPGGLHAYLDALVKAGVLIFLYGPAGMGKSYWCEELADRLGVPFGFTPMTEGALPSWLLGKVDLEGFKSTKLLDIWVNGGVYLLDEIDAADPNMLMVLNNPLANDTLENPVDQRTYLKSKKCIIVAAANTLGTGADSDYTARNQLDFSTLDRFRMGRAFVGYNADVEESILLQNAA